MEQQTGLETELAGIRLRTPLVPVSGIFGIDYAALLPGLPGVGAVVTKTITREPRQGNREPRVIEIRGGLLNAIGLHNPGVDAFIERELPKYRALDVPVIVSIAGKTDDDFVECATRLCGLDGVRGIEMNVSCPNVEKGVQFGSDGCMLESLVGNVRKVVSGIPLIVKLTPNVTDITVPAMAAINAGADALALINTLHGMAIDLNTQQPKLGNVAGGLSGGAVHPLAVYMIYKCYTACCRQHNIPIIGIGGVSTTEDALEMLLAGATCVGVGTAMFRDPRVCERIAAGIEDYLCCRNELSVASIIGKAAG
ncbi:MAG: dihydroorotate dehydrogenase [Armatimonadota bacterium]